MHPRLIKHAKALTNLAVVSLVALPTLASAVTLWDQSDFDPFGPGYFNSESGEPPFGITMHTVSDVTVGGSGWTVESISTFYSALDPYWGLGIAEGYLHVFDKTGPLPVDGSDDPTASVVVPMTGTLNGDHIVVTASALNLALDPGEYWIGITPIAPGGNFGPEIHLATLTYMGDDSASFDPFSPVPAWFVFNLGVDSTILIEGEVPTPTVETSWGSVKSTFQK